MVYKQFLGEFLSIRFQELRCIWSTLTRELLWLYSRTRTWKGKYVAWVLLCPNSFASLWWWREVIYHYWKLGQSSRKCCVNQGVTQLLTKITVAIPTFLCRYGVCTTHNFLWSVINKYLASYISNQQVDNNHSCRHTRTAKNIPCVCNSVS